jgi:hypothetical protein
VELAAVRIELVHVGLGTGALRFPTLHGFERAAGAEVVANIHPVVIAKAFATSAANE